MFRIECACTDTSRGCRTSYGYIITCNCSVSTCRVYRDDSGATDGGDFVRAKGDCSTGGGNIVVIVAKIYIQIQVGADSDILVTGIGNPIVKLSGGS